MSAVQVSRLPGGGKHVALLQGSVLDAVENAAGHFVRHSAGGTVCVAPVGRGFIVSLFDGAGRLESWRIIRTPRKCDKRPRCS